MKININKKFIHSYILAFFGLLMLVLFIWAKFLRERAPRNIPFNLTVIGFITLCFICVVYLYLCYRLFKPSSNNLLVSLFYPLIKKSLKPFYFFDRTLKKNKTIKHILFMLYLQSIIYFKLHKTKHNEYCFIIFEKLPRVLLLFSFILDIFYFNKFYLFYYILPFGLIAVFYLYSIYSITNHLHLITNNLEKNCNVIILSTKEEEDFYEQTHDSLCFMANLSYLKSLETADGVLHADVFIEWQCANLIFDYNLYKYTCIETWDAREHYRKKHKLSPSPIWIYKPESDEISKALAKEFKVLMPQAYYFKAFIDTYNKYVKNDFIMYDKYILVMYFICWMYILMISVHTLNIQELLQVFHTTWENIPDPFIGTKIL